MACFRALLRCSAGLRIACKRLWLHAPLLSVSGPAGARLAAGLAGAVGGSGGGGPGGKASVPASRLEKLRSQFRARARCNDMAGAEHCFRAYIAEGGQPLHWMLPMLLGMYGRLRQADKAWAIYRQLLSLRGRHGESPQGHGSQAETPSLGGGAGAGQGQAQQPAAGASATGGSQQQQQQQRSGGQADQAEQGPQQQGVGTGSKASAGQPAVQAPGGHSRSQQGSVAAEAARLVSELRMAALPLNEYAYGALITALSRAEHPPYDLPAHYALKAAEAFADMQAQGVRPNVVLWHNLMDCQAKAGQVDAAFATYRAMLASGTAPTSWTFSILVSACGRARQPQRAAEVVERLMPQARVKPQLPVWNALLGAYGRAGSVDAAYTAWLAMLDSGVVPDDCTERVLALAFASHPSLAADVVAEARQIRQQRQQQHEQQQQQASGAAAAGAEGRPAGAAEEEAGRQPTPQPSDGSQLAEPAAGGVEEGRQLRRPPYRLHQHRQTPLELDSLPGSSQVAHSPMAQLSDALYGAGSGGGRREGSAIGQEGQEAGVASNQRPALGDLLELDLHGSSQAAARMVLLRRLETLVLHAPEVLAEVQQMEEGWYLEEELAGTRHLQRHERQQQQAGQQQVGQQHKADEGAAEDAASLPQLHRQQSQEQAGLPERQGAAPAPASSHAGAHAVARRRQRLVAAGGLPHGERSRPPSLRIITGLGRHSKDRRGGVLKAAVVEVLRQQGLPVEDEEGNEGAVLVPWPPLAGYLQQQRQTMHTDHFLSAARLRYLYVFSGVAGIAAAAHLLPRLAPWMA